MPSTAEKVAQGKVPVTAQALVEATEISGCWHKEFCRHFLTKRKSVSVTLGSRNVHKPHTLKERELLLVVSRIQN